MYALILAVATAALPFTPAPGWVQLPQGALNLQVKSAWQGPALPGGKHESFTAVSMPFPVNPDVYKTTFKSFGVLRVVSNSGFKRCGYPARAVVIRNGSGADATISQQDVFARGGYSYMLTYVRPASKDANRAIGEIARTFCPPPDGKLPAFAVPPGWSAIGSFETIGTWMGPSPMQMMMLMKGPQKTSIPALVKSIESMSAPNAKLRKLVTFSVQQTTLCGLPAAHLTMRMNVPGMPMAADQMVTQANGVAYTLQYLHPGSAPADGAALASLKTLCALPTAAAPSPTPLPSPSAAPSPSPSPAASPIKSTLRR